MTLALGMGALFAALALAAWEVLAQRQPVDDGGRPFSGVARRASALAERTLADRGWSDRIAGALEGAGIDLRPGDLCLLAGAGSALGVVLGLVRGSVVLAVLLALAGPGVAYVYVSRRRSARREAFGEQVVQLLPSLAGSLRAGHSLVQAFELAGQELEAPLADELRRTATEVMLGRDLVESLTSAAERFDNEDLRWLVSAVQIHREVGGDLANVLDRVADTIRARDHLRRQVQSLSAEGRASAKVLTILPIGLALVLSVLNPSYVESFTDSAGGLVLLAGAVVLLVAGMAWLRTITRVEV